MKRLKRKGSDSYSEESDVCDEPVEAMKRKPLPRGKRSDPKKRQSAESTDDSKVGEILEIRNSNGTFQHQRPSFVQRWDGTSNELDITESEYRELPPGLTVYWRYKSKHMNALVFVQMGRIEFHAYENDAIRLNELFGKNIGKFSRCLMVHFWEKELELAKAELYRLKIPMHFMNEIEDPEYREQNKLIRREVTEVINPAVNITYTNEQVKDTERYLLTIFKSPTEERYGVAVVNCSVNKYYVEDVSHGQLRRVLNKFKPTEVVCAKGNLRDEKKMLRQISNPYICEMEYEQQPPLPLLEKLQRFNDSPVFETMDRMIEELPSGGRFQFELILAAIDLSLEYFKSLNLEKNIFGSAVFNFVSFESLLVQPVFDSQVYENLEIFELKDKENSFGEKGTLYAYLNRCVTGSGRRKLRKWLDSPLVDVPSIMERQQAVTDIIANFPLLKPLFQRLQQFPDFESRTAAVYHWVVDRSWKTNFQKNKDYSQSKNPVIVKVREIRELLLDIIKFEAFIRQIMAVHPSLSSDYLRELTTVAEEKDARKCTHSFFGVHIEQQRSFPCVANYCREILASVVFNERTGHIEPVSGTFPEFDVRKTAVDELYAKLDEELDAWKRKLGCNKLKYVSARNRNEIEMPKGTVKEKHKGLHFSSSTSKTERYTTVVSQQLTQELIIQEEIMDEKLGPFVDSIIQHFAFFKQYWTQVAEVYSELDVLFALAQVSREMEVACVPQFSETEFAYEDGLHVGLAQFNPKVVRNSVRFSKAENVLLITGPNMGGKSTILRQTCLLAIMAQIGCYVPAKSYTGVPFDRIFCRIGASDRIVEGKSTFYIELEETKRILDQASRNSLVIIDELGRGTSTFDGVSIAYGTLSYIVEVIGCFTLFSTHYSILADEFAMCPQVRNKTLEYHLNGLHLDFTYRLIDGVAERSFAENVARLVGIDEDILRNARERSMMVTKESRALRELQELTKHTNDLLVQFGLI